MIEDTDCKENCSFVKLGICKSSCECPNYTESIWEDKQSGQVKVVKDCSPKRILFEQTRMIGSFNRVEKEMQIVRDKVNSIDALLQQIINQSREFVKEQNKQKFEVENEKNPNLIV